jgi:hypothetical protein
MLPEGMKTGRVISPVERVKDYVIMWKLNIRLASSEKRNGFGANGFGVAAMMPHRSLFFASSP